MTYVAYMDPNNSCASDEKCRASATHDLWILGAVAAAVILISIATVIVLDARKRRLFAKGTAAQAVITALDPRGRIKDAGRVKVAVTLSVTAPDGGASFETWTTRPSRSPPSLRWAGRSPSATGHPISTASSSPEHERRRRMRPRSREQRREIRVRRADLEDVVLPLHRGSDCPTDWSWPRGAGAADAKRSRDAVAAGTALPIVAGAIPSPCAGDRGAGGRRNGQTRQ